MIKIVCFEKTFFKGLLKCINIIGRMVKFDKKRYFIAKLNFVTYIIGFMNCHQ